MENSVFENMKSAILFGKGTAVAAEEAVIEKEKVSVLMYAKNGTWRCYQIKISKSDYHAKNHNMFVGHHNYYVMPAEVYMKVRYEIPDGIGVYVMDETGVLTLVVKAKKLELAVNADTLKEAMVMALSKQVSELQGQGD